MPLPLTVDRDGPEPLYRQVERQLRAAIDAGRLRPGERLPSVRTIAEELGIGRLTVATAYEQLAADGYLVGRVGFGTVVAPDPPGTAVTTHGGESAGPRRRPPDGPVRRPPIDLPPPPKPASEALSPASSAFRYDLRPGRPSGADLAVGPALERLLREAWRDLSEGGDIRGASGGGDPLLRATIASHVRTTRGGRCEPDQVVVLSGALIGVSAVAALWLAAGAAVGVEDPGDPAFSGALAVRGARIHPVPVDRSGLRVDTLPADGLTAVLVSPTVQSATGVRMPLARRLRLLGWAGETGAIVVEDAQLDELALGPPAGPSLQGLDEDGRVVHLGGFATILHPGVQLGYAVVPRDLVEPFRAAVAAIDPGATPVQQRALGRFLADGHFDRHLHRVRRALAERLDAATESVRRELGWLVSVDAPAGGSRLVLTIEDETISARHVAELAARAGVGVGTLREARLASEADREVVLDVARLEPAALRQAVRELGQALGRTQAGRPQPTRAGRPAATPWAVGGRPSVSRVRSTLAVGAGRGGDL